MVARINIIWMVLPLLFVVNSCSSDDDFFAWCRITIHGAAGNEFMIHNDQCAIYADIEREYPLTSLPRFTLPDGYYTYYVQSESGNTYEIHRDSCHGKTKGCWFDIWWSSPPLSSFQHSVTDRGLRGMELVETPSPNSKSRHYIGNEMYGYCFKDRYAKREAELCFWEDINKD